MTGQKKAGLFGLGLAVAVLAGVAMVQGGGDIKNLLDPPPDMTFQWAAPTTGTPAAKYEVQIRNGGANSTDVVTRTVTTNRVTFSVDWLTLYEVRVRAIDASGRAGIWSVWSLAEDRDHEEPSF